MEDTSEHVQLRIGAQGRVVVPADLRAALGFEEGSIVVAHIEGEGRLVIESPGAVRRALLAEWAEVSGGSSLVDELIAERRLAAAREAEEVEADLAAAGDPRTDGSLAHATRPLAPPVTTPGRAGALLDASAVVAWLTQERGADVVDAYLPRAVISAVNLSEVLYRGQHLGRNVATLPASLGVLGLRVEPFTTADALVATEISARDRGRVLSLADRCCLATAVRLDLPVVTGDRAWATLDLGVEVLAFR